MGKYDAWIVVIGLAGLVVALYTLFGKDGATEQAAAAGKWVAQNIINPILAAGNTATTPVAAGVTSQVAAWQGGGQYYLSNVPATPAGQAPANWSWTLKNGTVLGLPAGMTPSQFAAANPDAPITAEINAENAAGKASGLDLWLASVLGSSGLQW